MAKQRELIADGDWVAEGRDIGTVVAPDAELKVFLTAVRGGARAPARGRAGRRRRDGARRAGPRDERDTARTHARCARRPARSARHQRPRRAEVVERIAALATGRRLQRRRCEQRMRLARAVGCACARERGPAQSYCQS